MLIFNFNIVEYSGEVTSVTGLDLDVSITLDLCHNRIYINFHPLVVIFDGVSALISTEWWLIFYLFIYISIYLSISLSIYLSIYLSLFIYLSIFLDLDEELGKIFMRSVSNAVELKTEISEYTSSSVSQVNKKPLRRGEYFHEKSFPPPPL